MSKTKSPRFVTATCACGASFEREVKRGRPQKWCPACVEVPFYERTVAPVAEVAEGEEAAPSVPGFAPEHDVLSEVRHLIEAEMAVVNAEHKERYAALVASGVDRYVAADQCDQPLRDAIDGVYAKYR